MTKANLKTGEKFLGAFRASDLKLADGSTDHRPSAFLGLTADGRTFLQYCDGEREFPNAQDLEFHLRPNLVWSASEPGNTIKECVEFAGTQADWTPGIYDSPTTVL